MSGEQKLGKYIKNILKQLDKDTRPIKNTSAPIIVGLHFSLIWMAVEEQTLVVSVYQRMVISFGFSSTKLPSQ